MLDVLAACENLQEESERARGYFKANHKFAGKLSVFVLPNEVDIELLQEQTFHVLVDFSIMELLRTQLLFLGRVVRPGHRTSSCAFCSRSTSNHRLSS
jgi:hypothetical protein